MVACPDCTALVARAKVYPDELCAVEHVAMGVHRIGIVNGKMAARPEALTGRLALYRGPADLTKRLVMA